MKHNKKRNVGIIYELLLGYISQKLVEDNKTGFLFESNNSDSLLALLSKRPIISTNVLEEYREQFSSQMMIDKYVEFYKDLLS